MYREDRKNERGRYLQRAWNGAKELVTQETQRREPPRGHVQRADWVSVEGSSWVGCVRRVARDGSWADVDWGTHTKRMPTRVLRVQTTLRIGAWAVTDLTREHELNGGRSEHA
jgi:hypothetical protein